MTKESSSAVIGQSSLLILLLLWPLTAAVGWALEKPAAGGGSAGARPFGPETGPVPSDEVLMRNGAVIGEIYVQTDDIFDPEKPHESKLVFQIANRLHVTTRAPVVEHKLLFRRGDAYDPRVLAETARYLRSLSYLYDAWVEPIRYRDNRVDILVRTRDVWTLGVGAGFERSGGENTLNFQAEEANLLGTGRFFEIKWADDPDRSSSRFRFVDLGLFGTRAELRLWYADNSDGHRQIFDLARPFYALDTRWAGATKILSDLRTDRLYHQGEVTHRLRHERTFGEIQGGISRGLQDGKARRWLFGYTFERDRLWQAGNSPGQVVPVDRRLSYVWAGIEEVEDRFYTTRNMDQLNRTEDFNLGRELRARLGFSSPSWGGDKSQAIFDADVRSGWALKPGQKLFVSGHASGRWGTGGHENVLVGGEVRYFLRDFGHHRLQATIRADAAFNLDPEDQLLLGGDNGLRGYPLRFQDGDRRFLISLEQRFYTNWELFSLIHVGAAVFFDAGRAWYDSGPNAGKDLSVLKDAGLGLRLSSSRSSNGQMVHFDVAFPLDGDTKKVQWLVTTKKSF